MTYFITASALLAVLVGGCGGSPSLPSSKAEFIYYTRTGGIAALDDELSVMTDGSATVRRKTVTHRFTLERGLFDRLQNEMRAANFTLLDVSYVPANTCCDQIDHRVRYHAHTVRMFDATIPQGMVPPLTTLNQVIETGSR